eukprot:s1038_g6.t1
MILCSSWKTTASPFADVILRSLRPKSGRAAGSWQKEQLHVMLLRWFSLVQRPRRRFGAERPWQRAWQLLADGTLRSDDEDSEVIHDAEPAQQILAIDQRLLLSHVLHSWRAVKTSVCGSEKLKMLQKRYKANENERRKVQGRRQLYALLVRADVSSHLLAHCMNAWKETLITSVCFNDWFEGRCQDAQSQEHQFLAQSYRCNATQRRLDADWMTFRCRATFLEMVDPVDPTARRHSLGSAVPQEPQDMQNSVDKLLQKAADSFAWQLEIPLSNGSYGHPELCAAPCIRAVFSKCTKGVHCDFCHFGHSKPKRKLNKPERQFFESLGEAEVLSVVLSILKEKFAKLPVEQQDAMRLLLAAIQTRVKSGGDPRISRNTRVRLNSLRNFSPGNLFDVIQHASQVSDSFKLEVKSLVMSARSAVQRLEALETLEAKK